MRNIRRHLSPGFLPVLLLLWGSLSDLAFAEDDRGATSYGGVWNSYSAARKASYLGGLCEGLNAKRGLIDGAFCGGVTANTLASKGRLSTFCGKVINDGVGEAIRYVDRFYAGPNHSDVAILDVAALHDDEVCGENKVAGRIDAINAANRCLRLVANMFVPGVSEAAREAQIKECSRLGDASHRLNSEMLKDPKLVRQAISEYQKELDEVEKKRDHLKEFIKFLQSKL